MLDVDEYLLKGRFDIKYLGVLQDEIVVCPSYRCLSGTTCVPVVVQYITTSLLLLSTSYNVSQLPVSWFCDHRVWISSG